ncbi:MAG: glycosyltransferase [Nitrososphaerota archaeon]|jgi:cellulose synthase/poly-beta-1,6-N-acetylglucosamine synthase-like glycosyltransferase|nr:glycosyltransferase [Nitrososphaerota archaeon]
MALTSYPKVSIIVASYNSADTIQECLQSLLAQDYPQDHVEILVMDGVSKDNTVQIAEQLGIKVVSVGLNAPAAYNYAQKIVQHSILGFVDSDAKVESTWLKKLVRHLNEPTVAGVSGSIETWNQTNPWAKCIGYELKNRYQRIGKYTNRIATMNLLLKKTVIEQAGGWNENLPSQYDTDFGYRITQQGYKIAYESTAICYHYNRPTLKAFYRQQLQYGKNTLKLYLKHKKLAQGDEITDIGMNIQPLLLLSAVVLFCLGFVPFLRLLWIGPPVILLGMLLYFTVSALKIVHQFHDPTAIRLIILYIIRAIAWFNGAITTTLTHLTTPTNDSKKTETSK